MRVFKQFRFEAAHSLPHLPEGHKCRNFHGHSYFVELQVELPSRYLAKNNGFVVDYADIAKAWEPLFAQLDHRNINEVIKPYSTCEYLAQWIWTTIKPSLPGLCKVRVSETPSAGVEYEGD